MNDNYDVVVVGLGTSGAIALITAARLGLSVIGVERLSGMGGTGTLGAVKHYYMGSRGGIYEDINEKAHSISPSLYAPNIDAKLYVLERAAVDAGAEIAYDTVVSDVQIENNYAKGLTLLSDGKTREIHSKFIIDCTGDAHILKMFGCKTRCGRAFDGGTQPFTNTLVTVKDGQTQGSNTDAGYVNQYDCENYSLANIKSLADTDILRMRDVVTNASILGVREGATIVGEENILLEEAIYGAKCDKPLFYAYSNVDHHGKDTAFEDDLIKEWYVAAGLWGINFSVPVPLGALIPKGFKGILAAGRHIAVDHDISPLVRMKSDMEKCGEAAGVIAYLAIRDGVSATEIDYESLIKILDKTGCSHGEHPVFINRDGHKKIEWPDTSAKIRNEFESGRPGVGIWGAKLLGDKVAEDLEKWVLEEGVVGDYAAIALGLSGRKTAIPRLRLIAERRDMTIPKTSLKYIYTLGTSAIYLLGKLGDADSVELLKEIVISRGEFDESAFVSDELYALPVDMRFQLFSYAVAAILDIREKCPSVKDELEEFLNKNILESSDNMFVTLKSNKQQSVDMFLKAKEYVVWRMKNK